MSYTLNALIAPMNVLHTAKQSFPSIVIVALEQDFGLIPLTDEVRIYLGDAEIKAGNRREFNWLTDGIIHLAIQVSNVGKIAYIEADFFGGPGHQASAVWENGTVILGPLWAKDLPLLEMPINRALRLMGASTAGEIDEFVAVDLPRHRSTEQWLNDK